MVGRLLSPGNPGAATQGSPCPERVEWPTAADMQVLLPLFQQSGTAMFDTGRKVLLFSDLAVKG